MNLPTGLDETIAAFKRACSKKGKQVDADVETKMIERLGPDFEANKGEWNKLKNQVLTVAALSGHLASLHAELDNKKSIVEWTHARKGLQAGKDECQAAVAPNRAKHCQNAKFDT